MLELVAAMDENRGIGWRGRVPWILQEDLRHFRDLTLGAVVIMGRKTWDSLPKRPLDRRINVVISRSQVLTPDAIHASSFEEAMTLTARFERRFVIGGASVYAAALESGVPVRLHLTRVEGVWPADTFFPAFDGAWASSSHWQTEGRVRYQRQFWESITPTPRSG
jgi:dihydrofolate reductase